MAEHNTVMKATLIIPLALAAVLTSGCGGGGPMTDAQAKSEARSIYTSSHLESDIKQLQTDGGNNNFGAVRSDARKVAADARSASAAVKAAHWPANYKGRAAKIEKVLAETVACMDAFSTANGLAEMQAAEQGKACQALNALSG